MGKLRLSIIAFLFVSLLPAQAAFSQEQASPPTPAAYPAPNWNKRFGQPQLMSLRLYDDRVRLGGQLRGRGELKNNFYVLNQVDTAGGQLGFQDFVLLRTRLAGEVKPTAGTGLFLMLQDAEEWNFHGPETQDFSMDIQQAYVYADNILDTPISIWAGRREVIYDNERLIGTSIGWGNKVFTYDGAMVTLEVEAARLDLFALNQVVKLPGDEAAQWFDNPRTLYGGWFTWQKTPLGAKVDYYFLFDNHTEADSDSYTTGLRLYGNGAPEYFPICYCPAGRETNVFDFDVEGIYQFGKFQGADRLAWAAHAEAGYTFEFPFKPRLGAEYNGASGDDDPGRGDFGTFDQLYAANHGKYGLMDLFSLKNMHEVNGNVRAFFWKGMNLTTWFRSFWLDSRRDAWYDSCGRVIRQDTSGRARAHVGNELDVLFCQKLGKILELYLFYGHFFPGGFVEDTGESGGTDYGYLEVRLNF
jgi:hypothetical protein